MVFLEYNIGDFVVVSSKVVRQVSSTGKVRYVKVLLPEPRLGQVTGLVRKFEGEIEYCSSRSSLFDASWEPPWLKVSNSRLFCEVRFGYLNKPVLVLYEGMRIAKIDEVEELPLLYHKHFILPPEQKRLICEDSKNWPRDEKGRWSKYEN